MINKSVQLFRISFAFVDVLALNIIHIGMVLILNKMPAGSERNYLFLFLAANISWLCSSYGNQLYVDFNSNNDRFSKKTIKTFIVFNILMLLFMFLYHYPYSRILMGASFVSFFLFLLLTRMFILGLNFYFKTPRRTQKKVVIVGYNEIAKTLVEKFATQRRNFHVAGYFEDEAAVTELSSLPIIGRIDECVEYAKKNGIQEIYSTVAPETNRKLYEMVQLAERSLIRFKFVPDFRMFVNRNIHMEYLQDIPILSLRPEPLEDSSNLFQKRIFDVVFSLIVIVFILSWLVPLLSIFIKLNSPGPIFFVQMRSGKNNRQFKCFKFRTLRVNDEANVKQVTRNDERHTKLGKFLRKSNLDELPQFFNVLVGDMSIVGPRPHMLKHTSSFSKLLEEYMIRHFVKPGVTGWAQVNGYRGEIKETDQLRKRIEYDIWYMENWSLWLDVKIIWLTVYSTIKGDKNAY